MYRCLTCQKPFTSFKTIVVNDIFGEYTTEVTPCCGLFSFSHLANRSFVAVSGGSAMSFGTVSEDEANEIALNWAIDFQKEQ